jgi:hypothetical protein
MVCFGTHLVVLKGKSPSPVGIYELFKFPIYRLELLWAGLQSVALNVGFLAPSVSLFYRRAISAPRIR